MRSTSTNWSPRRSFAETWLRNDLRHFIINNMQWCLSNCTSKNSWFIFDLSNRYLQRNFFGGTHVLREIPIKGCEVLCCWFMVDLKSTLRLAQDNSDEQIVPCVTGPTARMLGPQLRNATLEWLRLTCALFCPFHDNSAWLFFSTQDFFRQKKNIISEISI